MSAFHGTYAWKKARHIAKLKAGFACERCGKVLPNKGELHVHHKKAVANHPAVALEPLNFAVMCPACHNIIEPRSGGPPRLGCDGRGWPLSLDHPWNAQP